MPSSFEWSRGLQRAEEVAVQDEESRESFRRFARADRGRISHQSSKGYLVYISLTLQQAATS